LPFIIHVDNIKTAPLSNFSFWFSFLLLLIQNPLPPITPLIGRGIHLFRDARNIQILHRGVGAVHDEGRHARLVRGARLGEVGDVLLQGDGDGRAGIDWVGVRRAVVVGVSDVGAVQGRRHGEEVGVGGVGVGFVEVEGVAGEDEFRVQGGGARDLVRIGHGLAAVEDGRVEDVGDVVDHVRVGGDGGEGLEDCLAEGGVVLDEGGGEEEALGMISQYMLGWIVWKEVTDLVGIVSNHDFDISVELAVE